MFLSIYTRHNYDICVIGTDSPSWRLASWQARKDRESVQVDYGRPTLFLSVSLSDDNATMMIA